LYGNSFITVFHLHLKEGTDINSTIEHINKRYCENIAHSYSYSNIPNLITMTTWAETAQESQRIQKELQSEGFKDIMPYIFLSLNWYDCWIDQLLRSK